MALNIGTLTGFLNLDVSQFDQGLVDAGEDLKDFGSKGAGLAKAAAAGIGAGLVAGVLDNLNMEPVKDKLSAQLGLTGKDAAEAGKVAAELYRSNFGENLSEVSEAVRAVVQNMNVSINSADFKPLAAQAMTLANTFDQDLGETTKAVGQLIKTGMVRDAQEGLDLLAKGFQTPGVAASDFLDTLSQSSGTFNQFGLTGQSSMGLIKQALDAGAPSADFLSGALEELAGNAGDSADTFATLGLNGAQMARDLSAGGPAAAGALDMLLDALRDIEDPAARSTAMVGLFGEEATALQGALLALDPSSAVAGLGNLEGAAQGVVDTVGSNAQSTIDGYRKRILGVGQDAIQSIGPLTAIAGAAAAFGPAVLGTLAPLASLIAARGAQTAATAAATAATAAATGAQAANTGATSVGLASRLSHTAATVLGAAVVGGALVASFVASTAATVAHAAATVASTAVMGVARAAVAAWTAAQWLLNAALSANPIGLVVLAVAALAAGLAIAWQRSETFRNIVTGAFSKVLSAVSALLGGIESMLRALGKIPGFGWADTAANKVAGARASVDGLNASLNRIPANVSTTVTTRYVVVGDPAKSVRGGVTERASGGPVSPFGSYLVGEHGPELLTMGSFGGQITPAGTTRDALAGAGGGGKHFHLTVTARETVNVQDEFHRMELLAG